MAWRSGFSSLPRDFAQQSEILDMQHRVYGWHDKRRDMSERIIKMSNLLQDAKDSGQKESVAALQVQLKALQHTRDRFGS